MGSISFQVVGDGTVGTRTKTYTVPDEHINRLVAWAQDEFRLNGEESITPAQALLRWSEMMMGITRQRVVAHERAAAAIAPFEAT